MPGYYLIDGRTRTITPVSKEMYEERHRLQSSTRRIVPAYSSEIQRYLKLGFKMTNPYMGFKKLVSQLEKRGAESPAALAAWIGRRKYGKEAFQKMAAAGKKRRSNPVGGEKTYMITTHTPDGKLYEAAYADTMKEVAEYLSREVSESVPNWAVWKGRGQIAGGSFVGDRSWLSWLQRIVAGGVQWSPKRKS